MKKISTALAVALAFAPSLGLGYTNGFESAEDLNGITITGTAEVDTTRSQSGSSSLRVNGGAVVTIPLADVDHTARVEMWVYDDMSIPADPLERRNGARWGVLQKDDRFLGVSLTYAPYVATATNYVTQERAPSGGWFDNIQFLTQGVRKEGWRKWVFDINPENDIKLFIDDTQVVAFNATKSSIVGISAIRIYGDVVDDYTQTIWIDDINVELRDPTGELPEEDPIVPSADPDYEGEPITLLSHAQGHPRLMLNEEKIAALRAFYNSEEGTLYANSLNSYATTQQNVAITDAFLTDDTEGQRVGIWQLPSLALHYLLTDDTASRDKAIEFLEYLLAQEHWQLGDEEDAGMGAGNVMFGAAAGFDWLYDELDPDFREAFREKLWDHARRMYYRGHLMRVDNTHYWQNDPQNNHRFHRNLGLVGAAIAAFEGEDDQMWLMNEILNELDYIARWLPEDGSSHESPSYFVFGLVHIVYSMGMADYALGTNHWNHPYFRNATTYRIQTIAPGMQTDLPYGDGSGLAYYNPALYPLAWKHGRVNELARLDAIWEKSPSAFPYAWMALLGYDPSVDLSAGDPDMVPKKVRFPDLDLVYMRQGWATNHVAALFKSGPFGGYSLNDYRDSNNFSYINVAHDDPDANSFIIWRGRQFVKTDGYSYSKKSANHNTILVNGKGQRVPGRAEGGQWSQPTNENQSMRDMAYMTLWVDSGDIAIAEGEAANSYIDSTLNRFRRGFIWSEGKYILLVDDIRAGQSENITWLVQGKEVRTVDEAEGKYSMYEMARTEMPFQIVASDSYTAAVAISTADNRGTILGYEQLQVSFNTDDVKIATVFDAWSKGVSVQIETTDVDSATITVTGADFVDVWTWTAGDDARDPGTYVLASGDQEVFNSAEQPDLSYFDGLAFRIGEWIESDWLGYFYQDEFPWVYHANHGWIYCPEKEDVHGAIYYDLDLGWVYSSKEYYPWIWQFNQDRWIAFFSGAEKGRWFGAFDGDNFDYFQP